MLAKSTMLQDWFGDSGGINSLVNGTDIRSANIGLLLNITDNGQLLIKNSFSSLPGFTNNAAGAIKSLAAALSLTESGEFITQFDSHYVGDSQTVACRFYSGVGPSVNDIYICGISFNRGLALYPTDNSIILTCQYVSASRFTCNIYRLINGIRTLIAGPLSVESISASLPMFYFQQYLNTIYISSEDNYRLGGMGWLTDKTLFGIYSNLASVTDLNINPNELMTPLVGFDVTTHATLTSRPACVKLQQIITTLQRTNITPDYTSASNVQMATLDLSFLSSERVSRSIDDWLAIKPSNAVQIYNIDLLPKSLNNATVVPKTLLINNGVSTGYTHIKINNMRYTAKPGAVVAVPILGAASAEIMGEDSCQISILDNYDLLYIYGV